VSVIEFDRRGDEKVATGMSGRKEGERVRRGVRGMLRVSGL
jgi:hypothetical protein